MTLWNADAVLEPLNGGRTGLLHVLLVTLSPSSKRPSQQAVHKHQICCLFSSEKGGLYDQLLRSCTPGLYSSANMLLSGEPSSHLRVIDIHSFSELHLGEVVLVEVGERLAGLHRQLEIFLLVKPSMQDTDPA